MSRELLAEAIQIFADRATYYRLSGHYEVTPDELEVIMADILAAITARGKQNTDKDTP